MDGRQFKAWRERLGLTQQQVADKLGVTRTTVQNWENAGAIPQAVEMSCEVWEPRLKQENADIGPVTLVYSDGPMFVNPYGPRGRLAMMHQEPYPTNSAAIARVEQLWDRDDFHNAFIIEESGKPLWNVVELTRVVAGKDKGAPTLVNLVRAIAKSVRANSTIFVRSGPKTLSPSEAKQRQQAIEAQADELDRLADSGLQSLIKNQQKVEGVFSTLLALGTKAPDSLVYNVAQAFVVFERNQTPPTPEGTLVQGGYMADYRGFEISWPEVRIDASRWTVNLSSSDRRLLGMLGGRTQIFTDPHSIESCIQRAKLHVDDLLAQRH
jgi:helix-turn-helix protein